MKKRYYLIPALSIFILLSACENLPFPWDDFENPDFLPFIKILTPEQVRELPKDPYVLKAVVISGDTISFTVEYGGGCAEHDFVLANFGGFMESEPVQTKILLSHEDNDDACDAIETREVRFNLLPLKLSFRAQYPDADGVIILQIVNPQDPNQPGRSVRYVFE
ncbi:hypothetical protein JW935_24295 [candidate division KSB1 bacterium]|nr:hypothetical protein [candidate division KSB1 bacterium]